MNEGIHYKRIGKRRYELLSKKLFATDIEGADGWDLNCEIDPDGLLTVYSGFQWDMASGAVDTPDMAIASLAHDALCVMINSGSIPKKYQKHADREFRRILKQQRCGFVRRWYSWAAVRLFQIFKR